MFPYSQHAPPFCAQYAIDLPVSRFVRLQLGYPEPFVALGLNTMLRATVPEAAIHEHGQLLLGKGKVGTANYRIVSAPTGDAIGTKQLGERNFGGLVALAPDA